MSRPCGVTGRMRERLFSLAHLPILTATARFQFFAEPAHLVRERLVRRRAHQEPAHPADAVRRGFLFTSCTLRTNSPNYCSEVSSSRMAHLGPLVGNQQAK